jgi:hypothetical protein
MVHAPGSKEEEAEDAGEGETRRGAAGGGCWKNVSFDGAAAAAAAAEMNVIVDAVVVVDASVAAAVARLGFAARGGIVVERNKNNCRLCRASLFGTRGGRAGRPRLNVLDFFLLQ